MLKWLRKRDEPAADPRLPLTVQVCGIDLSNDVYTPYEVTYPWGEKTYSGGGRRSHEGRTDCLRTYVLSPPGRTRWRR